MDTDVAEDKTDLELIIAAADDSRWARCIVEDLQTTLFRLEEHLRESEADHLVPELKVNKVALGKVKELLELTENASGELYERMKEDD